jgi:plasmid stabilization system protein ParE
MRVTYHPEAEAELIEAVEFYESKVSGLGQRFLSEFEAAISTIEEAPMRWQIIEGDLHRYLIRRFPYGIYYRVEADELRILVVKHHSRHPDYWKYRLDP